MKERGLHIALGLITLIVGLTIGLSSIYAQVVTPDFRIVDVRAEYGQIVFEVEHFKSDGTFWFFELYTFQGREGKKFPRMTNEKGELLLDDGTVAPYKLLEGPVSEKQWYLPEGRDWMYSVDPFLGEGSVLGIIRKIYSERLKSGWEKGQSRLTVRPLDYEQRDIDGLGKLLMDLGNLEGVSYKDGLEITFTASVSLGKGEFEWGTVSTFYPDTDPEVTSVDGHVYREVGAGSSWAGLRDGAGTVHNSNASLEYVRLSAHTTSNLWDYIIRTVTLFDTSALPDTDTISSSTIQLYADEKVDGLPDPDLVSMVTTTPASNTNLAVEDYGQFGSVKQAADVAYGDISTTGYSTWTLNATGLGNVNKTGISKFGFRHTADNDNAEPTWSSGQVSQIKFNSAEEAYGGERRPVLSVTHTSGATGSAAITGTIGGDGDSEQGVRDGDGTIVITLTNDTFISDITSVRQDIIDGLDSAQSEVGGWNNNVRDSIGVASVVRTSSTVVTITVSGTEVSLYRITSDETITVTVPASALTGAVPLTGSPTFTIYAYAESLALSGTLSDGATEAQIRTGGETLALTLSNAKWVTASNFTTAVKQAIIDGLNSAQLEDFGWNLVVRDTMDVSAVTRTSSSIVSITLPAFSGYDISVTETVSGTAPVSAMLYSLPISGSPTFSITPASIAADITGTMVSGGVTEQEVRDGGETIIITLVEDSWELAGASFDAVRQDIIDGMDSAQSEANGWDAEVKVTVSVGSVIRTSDTVVTITVTSTDVSGFRVTANETITVTVPASAMVISGSPVIGSPTFTVTAAAESSAITGTLSGGGTEGEIRVGSETVIVTLTNTKWMSIAGGFNAQRQAILDGMDSAQGEAAGWNAVVPSGVSISNVVRTSDTIVTITFDAIVSYNITATETITVNVPSSSLVYGAAIAGSPTFSITTIAGTATITGTIGDGALEQDVRDGEGTIIITLLDDEWIDPITTARQAIINGLDSAQAETFGWDARVKANMGVGSVIRTSATVVTVTVSSTEVSTFRIASNETVTVTVPISALVYSGTPIVATPTITITAAVESLAVTGTLSDGGTEAEIRSGGETVILTLTNTKWKSSGVPFNGARQAIIDGLDSAQAGTFGWNNEVRDKLSVDTVIRTSDNVVTITLSAQSAYEITATETITNTSPISALLYGTSLTGSPTFEITVVEITADITGTIGDGATEEEVRDGDGTIIITLTGDTWVDPITSVRQAIIDGMDSAQAETNGWNSKVRDAISVGSVIRTSDTVVTITVSSTEVDLFRLASNETITVTVPSSALETSSVDEVGTPTILITAVVESIAITGSLSDGGLEAEIVAGGETVVITLTNVKWITLASGFNTYRQNIINGMDSDGAGANGWDARVKTGIGVSNVVRTSDTVVTITFPAISLYSITSSETVTVTVPAAALMYGALIVASPTFVMTPDASVAITGTIGNGATEQEVRDGSGTIIVTVTNDTFEGPGAAFDAVRQGIIDGIDSAQSEANGWDAKVKGTITVNSVVRTSATVVTVTVSAAAVSDFRITSNETVTVTVPGSALVLTPGNIVATPTILITSATESAAVTGTLSDGGTEGQIRAGSETIVITLTNTKWVLVGDFDAQRQSIINGLDSGGVEVGGWNNEVRDTIDVSTVVRTSDTVVTITLPVLSSYSITANETITVTVPSSALVYSVDLAATPTFTITFEGITAAVTGTLGDGATEQEVRDGGQTIIITLSEDTWESGTTFDAQRQAILNGLDSAQSEAFGWDAEVKVRMNVYSVVRTSDTIVTITVSSAAVSDFRIDSNETITATVPADAIVLGASPVVASPTFQVTAASEVAALSNTLSDGGTEAQINAGAEVLVITLTNTKWISITDGFDAQRQGILDGMNSDGAEAAGWDATVPSGVGVSNVVRTSDTVVTITFPAIAGYEITATETITVTVPTAALAYGANLVSTPTFAITPTSVTAAVTGTLGGGGTEQEVRDGGETVIITLSEDTWVAGGTFDGQRQNIISGLDSAQGETFGWNNEVRDRLNVYSVVRTSDTIATVTVSSAAVSAFRITSNETVTVTVPVTALTSGVTGVTASPTFTVTASVESAALTGTLSGGGTETEIVTGSETLVITLTNTKWISIANGFDDQRQTILNGMDSAQSEAEGWDATVPSGVSVTNVVRTSDTVVTITFNAVVSYAITATETITVTVPTAAIVYGLALTSTPTFNITATSITAAVSGTIGNNATEQEVRDGEGTIVITLSEDTWESGGTFDAQRQAIINGLDSAQSETYGWNAEVQARLGVGSVVRTSNTIVTITVSGGEVGNFRITADETITVTVPAGALVISGSNVTATPTFAITAATESSAVTGTIGNGGTEQEVREGDETIIITLSGTTWITNTEGLFNAQRQAIIDGIDSAQSEAAGWDVQVKAALDVSTVVRTSNTVVTITLTSRPLYSITSTETITVTVPAAAMDYGAALVGSPTFNVTNTSTTAALTGTLSDGAGEQEIVDGAQTAIITLTGVTWVAAGATFNAQRQAIIDGFDSAGVEAGGWNNQVRDVLDVSAVVRTSDTVVTVSVTGSAGYSITANETITVTVPSSALVSPDAITASPTFTISIPTAAITGTIGDGGTEQEIIDGAGTIVITLTGTTWVDPITAQRQAIINGIDSAQSEANGWDVEKANLGVSTVVLTSSTIVTVTLTALATYEITANETLTVTVPAAAINTSDAIVATPTITITFTPAAVPTVTVSGTIGNGASATELTDDGGTVILTLVDDTWLDPITSARQDIIDGLDSDGSDTFGWNATVRDSLDVSAVVRTSSTVVTITIAAVSGYEAGASETITVTVPASALTTYGSSITATPTFTITVSGVTIVAGLFFMGLVVLSLGLTVVSFREKFLPTSLGASISWLALGAAFITSAIGPGFSVLWVQAITILFILLAFIPLIGQMRQEVRNEVFLRGKKSSWITYETGGKELNKQSPYDAHREKIRKAIGRKPRNG